MCLQDVLLNAVTAVASGKSMQVLYADMLGDAVVKSALQQAAMRRAAAAAAPPPPAVQTAPAPANAGLALVRSAASVTDAPNAGAGSSSIVVADQLSAVSGVPQPAALQHVTAVVLTEALGPAVAVMEVGNAAVSLSDVEEAATRLRDVTNATMMQQDSDTQITESARPYMVPQKQRG
eukprot:jgi/Chrzof1/2343/Cz11g11200.t1